MQKKRRAYAYAAAGKELIDGRWGRWATPGTETLGDHILTFNETERQTSLLAAGVRALFELRSEVKKGLQDLSAAVEVVKRLLQNEQCKEDPIAAGHADWANESFNGYRRIDVASVVNYCHMLVFDSEEFRIFLTRHHIRHVQQLTAAMLRKKYLPDGPAHVRNSHILNILAWRREELGELLDEHERTPIVAHDYRELSTRVANIVDSLGVYYYEDLDLEAARDINGCGEVSIRQLKAWKERHLLAALAKEEADAGAADTGGD